MSAPRLLFSPGTSDVATVKQARLAFFKAGKVAEWNGLVESWLRETLEAVPTSASGAGSVNVGSTFRKAVAGTPAKQKILAEALRGVPDGPKNVAWLMETLDATGRAMGRESYTAFYQQAQRDLERQGAGVLAPILETVEIWRTPSRMASAWKAFRLGRYTENIAEIITSKNGQEALTALRDLSPRSPGAVAGLMSLMAQGADSGLGDLMSLNSPDVMPEILQGASPRSPGPRAMPPQ